MEQKEGEEVRKFNVAQQSAIEKAMALPGALYGTDVEGMRSSKSVDGITIIRDEGDHSYDVSPTEESFLADEHGDVLVNYDVHSGGDIEFFPSQLTIEDIVEIIKNGADKMSLMVKRGVDPNTTPREKLQRYVFSTDSGASTYVHNGKEMSRESYVKLLLQEYTDLWNKREEKRTTTSKALKNKIEDHAKQDEKAAEMVRDKIKRKVENTTHEVIHEERTPLPAPAKKGFLKRIFGLK